MDLVLDSFQQEQIISVIAEITTPDKEGRYSIHIESTITIDESTKGVYHPNVWIKFMNYETSDFHYVIVSSEHKIYHVGGLPDE